jgi:hypothetical protein
MALRTPCQFEKKQKPFLIRSLMISSLISGRAGACSNLPGAAIPAESFTAR